jgi:sedoheptulose-bisphosphatase
MTSFMEAQNDKGAYKQPTDNLPSEISSLLSNSSTASGLEHLLGHVMSGCRRIADNLRAGDQYSTEQVGTQNAFGDNQLDVDVKTDVVLFDALKDSGVVHVGASEENPIEVPCGGTGYSAGFDPLDGSSIYDANFAVGTIMGIWPGATLLGRKGSEQAAALVVQYGPRVTMALALNAGVTGTGKAVSVELTMLSRGWKVTIPEIVIKAKAKTFAPGNLRATQDNKAYSELVNYWITNKYTLRYSGGLVPDVYHIFIKGQGVLSNASSPSCKAKLRLLFEAAPIALIVEAAGGESCACPSEAAESMLPVSLLEVPIDDLDRRVGVCYGSSEEVTRFRSTIFS